MIIWWFGKAWNNTGTGWYDEVIAEANDGEECLNLLNKKIHPDILLLDINMPKKNGNWSIRIY